MQLRHGPATVDSPIVGLWSITKEGNLRGLRGEDDRFRNRGSCRGPCVGPSPKMGLFCWSDMISATAAPLKKPRTSPPLRRLIRRLGAAFLYIGLASPIVAAPQRVVSLLPSHTDILVLLGSLGQVAAVSDGEDPLLYPALPRVGGMEMSWEALVRLKPDLILADVSHRRHDAQFQRHHLPVVYLPSTEASTLEEVFDLVAAIGRLMDREEQAGRWISQARERVIQLDERRQAAPGPRIYFEVWPQPLQACGPRSLAGHLISRVGGQNVVTDPTQAVPLMSAEALVRADPQLILHTGVQSSADIQARPGWSSMTAVKAGRVVQVNSDDFSRAGPGILDAWDFLLKVLERGAP